MKSESGIIMGKDSRVQPGFKWFEPRAFDWNMIVTPEGSCSVFSENRRLCELTQGSVFLFSPGRPRSYEVKTTRTGIWCHFVPEHTPDWKRCSGNCYRCCPEETVFARICDSITEAYELYLSRSPGWHILTRHLLEEIVLRGNSRPDLNAVPPQILHAQRLLNDLNFHYEDFEEIAHLTGLSRSVFFRLFREHTGTTPQRYRESRMLRLATALLEASDLTLNEIASRTGFSDPYYFSHRFKAAFHQSPGTYRRSLRVNADSGK